MYNSTQAHALSAPNSTPTAPSADKLSRSSLTRPGPVDLSHDGESIFAGRLLAGQGRNLQQCVARLFSGWEGPLVLFQRERTKQTLDPYYECHTEHDADYQQQQETIELLNSSGFCIRGIHDYLLVPVIKFE
jgi:hypothetical protein